MYEVVLLYYKACRSRVNADFTQALLTPTIVLAENLDTMYTHVLIILIGITCILCYSNNDIFDGFDADKSIYNTNDIAYKPRPTTLQTPISIRTSLKPRTTITETIPTTTSTIIKTLKTQNKTAIKVKEECPEEDIPVNIGTYEVPTEKDLVLFTKDLLLTMFRSYERDAILLLRDIKEVTKGATAMEAKCQHNKQAYIRCVKRVSGQSTTVTKNLVTSLEMEKMNIRALTENKICSLSDMKGNPMSLVKMLAQENAMIKYALPGLLRLLQACYAHCLMPEVGAYAKRPLRRLTDQELVVKYFLKNKNYIGLIKDSRRGV